MKPSPYGSTQIVPVDEVIHTLRQKKIVSSDTVLARVAKCIETK